MSSAPTVLVTGGAGYVGGHTCKQLAAAGFVPVAYDNLGTGHRWAVRWGPFEEGDINDTERLGAVLVRHKPVAVMHFAAHSVASESVSDPDKYYRNNVVGTLALLNTMRVARVNSFVFSSSAAVYGNPQKTPIPEDHATHPINPYGASKLMVEQMLQDFYHAYGLNWASLRYFNAAGADPDGLIGEAHAPETHVVPLAIEAALGKRSGFQLFGTDYPTPDGTAIRDYVHVTDLAVAHVLALRHLLAAQSCLTLNLGTGNGHSVRDVLGAVERVSGRSIVTHAAPRRPGDPPILVADPDRAWRLLGWRAQHTGLDAMVGSAWRWHARREDVVIP